MRIGEILRDKAGLSEQQIEQALEVQRSTDKRLGSVLVEMGLVDPDLVAEALAELKHVPPAKRAHFQRIAPEVIALLPAKLARQYGAIPLGVSTKLGKVLVVAMRDPTSASDVETMQFAAGMDIRPAAASEFFIDQCLDQFYPQQAQGELTLQQAPGPSTTPGGHGEDPESRDGAPPLLERSVGRPGQQFVANAPRALPPPPSDIPQARVRGGTTTQIIGLVFAVLGFFAGSWAVKNGCKRAPATQDVSGTFVATHVDARIDFPDGWKYLSGKNESQRRMGMTARMSLFYRGGTADIPHDAFIIGYLDTKNRLPEMSDRKFLNMVKVSAKNMRAPGSSSYSMTVGKCQMSSVRDEQAGECVGTAAYKGKTWNMFLVMWLGKAGRVYIAAPLSRDSLDDARDWMEPMISSVTAD